ncbi:MAG: alpha/beta fold hydrolase BchO [Gemmatimonadaceae bacterium]|nr:alpha/beta fold hydrolase BchO [Gemmatimonadaceae bacterium]
MPDTADQSPILPADWPQVASSFFVTAAGLRWHVQRAGRGPAVLLVHGTAGATHTWRGVWPLLTAWADVIAFDLPGHGFTTGATPDQLSLVGMADAIHDLLRTLGVQPVIAVGHSAGAAVLLQMASSHEVTPQSLIGVNSALVSINALGQMLLPFSRALFDLDPVRAAIAALLRNGTVPRELLRSTGTPLDPAQEARYVAMLTNEARVGAALRMMSRWDLPALQARFPLITVPVTLVHSSNEPWVPFAELLDVTRTLPMRSVIDMAPAGHLIPDEKPQQLADVIASTFAAVTSRTG